MHPGSKIFAWLFVVAAVALAAFMGGLLVWGSQVDLATRHREQFLVGEGVQARVAEVAATVTPQADWDDAVQHLAIQFDPAWARSNITARLEQNGGFQTIVVLGGGDIPIYASQDGIVRGGEIYAPFEVATHPLLAQVRNEETQRGPLAPRAGAQAGRVSMISRPIQASNFEAIGGKAFLVTATLVQPDIGATAPILGRAPVIVTMLPVDGSFTRLLASRFKLGQLAAHVGQKYKTLDMARSGQGVLRLATSDPGAPLVFAWRPQTPGARLVRTSLPIISVVLALVVAAGVLMVRRLTRVARRLDASEAEARVNLDRLHLALRSTRAGVFEVDFRRQTSWCSPEFVEVVGRELTFAEASGEGWPMVHPDDQPEVAAQVRERRGGAGPTVLEFRVVLPDGEVRWIHSRGDLRLAEDGTLDSLSGFVLDIDERKRQELALMEARRAAEAAAEAKSQFLANMSHELRTPMNGVLGLLHLIGREPLSTEGRALLNQAQTSGELLAEVLKDVVDFSAADAGRLDLSPAPLDPAELLQGVVGLLTDQAQAKGVALIAETPDQSTQVMADAARLRQVLHGLVGNAIKFTEHGQVRASLTVTDEADGRQRLWFEIEDTGIGVPESARANLFEPFRQADASTSRQHGGSGLGLALARRLVEIMGGVIGFTSVEGRGSTFWLDLPVEVVRRHTPAPQDQSDQQAQGLLAGLEILVVEDNPTNRLVATKLLESLGAATTVAVDGQEGLELAQERPFDLILMDIQMPRMDGVDATRRIRALDGPVSRTPIVALTANVLAHQCELYREVGMNGVVAKPVSAMDLATELVRALNDAADDSAPSFTAPLTHSA